MKTLDNLFDLMEMQLEELKKINESLRPKERKRSGERREQVPYKEIQDLFNGLCTGLKACQVLNPKRERAIKKLWSSYLPDLERWGQYFNLCNQDVWFNGVKYSGNIDTILQEDKVIRMFEEGPRHE